MKMKSRVLLRPTRNHHLHQAFVKSFLKDVTSAGIIALTRIVVVEVVLATGSASEIVAKTAGA